MAAAPFTSGLPVRLGFLLLAAAWAHGAWRAMAAVHGGRIDEHGTSMVRDHALTFAAVLRVLLGMGLLATDRGYGVSFDEVYGATDLPRHAPELRPHRGHRQGLRRARRARDGLGGRPHHPDDGHPRWPTWSGGWASTRAPGRRQAREAQVEPRKRR